MCKWRPKSTFYTYLLCSAPWWLLHLRRRGVRCVCLFPHRWLTPTRHCTCAKIKCVKLVAHGVISQCIFGLTKRRPAQICSSSAVPETWAGQGRQVTSCRPHDRSRWSWRWLRHIVYRRRRIVRSYLQNVYCKGAAKHWSWNRVEAAIAGTIRCHTVPYIAILLLLLFCLQTSFLRRDFWYLKRDGARVRARAALSPRVLLNPFAPFFRWPTCRIRYVAPTLRIRIVVICVSLRLQKKIKKYKFTIWLLAKARAAFWHFVCIWTNFDCAWPESAAAHESNQLRYVFRPNVIMEYGEIADCKPVCLW